jgi:hypothetical protein
LKTLTKRNFELQNWKIEFKVFQNVVLEKLEFKSVLFKLRAFSMDIWRPRIGIKAIDTWPLDNNKKQKI